MPAHHRFREDGTLQRIRARAARVGPNVAIFAGVVMRGRKHPAVPPPRADRSNLPR